MKQSAGSSRMSSLEELFCNMDDFCQAFEPKWKRQLVGNSLKTRSRNRSLGLSEIMTILITFHQSHYRNFKSYYLHQVCQYWSDAFPGLVSYSRFVTWRPSCMMPLCCYLKTCFGTDTGISFVDATCLEVCHNRRIGCSKALWHEAKPL